MTSLDQLTEDAVVGLATGDPDWLRDRRQEAYKRWLDQEWPNSRQDEYWRSTNFTKKIDVTLSVVSDGTDDVDVPDGLVDSLPAASAELRIVDGAVEDATVPAALAAQGLVVMDLADAARSTEHGEIVRTHLGSLTTSNRDGTGADEDRTITLNDAAWTTGAFVHVPSEVEVDEPIGIHLHVTRPGAHLPRVLIVMEHHARATVYLEHTSDLAGDGARALVDQVVEAKVGDGARLHVASINEWGRGTTHLALQKAELARDATYRHLSVNVGGDTIRLRPEVDLVGPGASCFPLGLYFADEGQHFDLQPYIRHLAPRATSDVLYKGALQGRSRTIFRGNVYVAANAVGTVTDENNRTLILTAGAKADSTPFLEIHCADIRAGHGSATGQIDARALFYLEARGIPRDEALRLMVYGFFAEVLDAIETPGVAERALAHIEREIDQADLDAIGVNDAALAEVGDA